MGRAWQESDEHRHAAELRDELATDHDLVRTMEENAALVEEQLQVATDRAQSWRNIAERNKDEVERLRAELVSLKARNDDLSPSP